MRGDIAAIAPTSDNVAFYLAQVSDLLPDTLQGAYAAPDRACFALFKERFIAEIAQVSTPPTCAPKHLDAALSFATAVGYPVVIKPRSHVVTPWARGGVAENERELIDAFKQYPVPAGFAPLIGSGPELALPVIQKNVVGPSTRLFSISGIVKDGETLVAAAAEKHEQAPPGVGVGLVFRPANVPEVLARGAAFAATLGAGIFELEIAWDEASDVMWALDLNPRAHGQIRLDISRGLDLPWLWYQLASGEAPQLPDSLRDDVEWHHPVLLAFHHGLKAEGRAALRRLGRTEREVVDIVLDHRDPAPGALFLARMLRHPGGLRRIVTGQAL